MPCLQRRNTGEALVSQADGVLYYVHPVIWMLCCVKQQSETIFSNSFSIGLCTGGKRACHTLLSLRSAALRPLNRSRQLWWLLVPLCLNPHAGAACCRHTL
jgi:hypothetical protein